MGDAPLGTPVSTADHSCQPLGMVADGRSFPEKSWEQHAAIPSYLPAPHRHIKLMAWQAGTYMSPGHIRERQHLPGDIWAQAAWEA